MSADVVDPDDEVWMVKDSEGTVHNYTDVTLYLEEADPAVLTIWKNGSPIVHVPDYIWARRMD